jgi:hypothetical protein
MGVMVPLALVVLSTPIYNHGLAIRRAPIIGTGARSDEKLEAGRAYRNVHCARLPRTAVSPCRHSARQPVEGDPLPGACRTDIDLKVRCISGQRAELSVIRSGSTLLRPNRR